MRLTVLMNMLTVQRSDARDTMATLRAMCRGERTARQVLATTPLTPRQRAAQEWRAWEAGQPVRSSVRLYELLSAQQDAEAGR